MPMTASIGLTNKSLELGAQLTNAVTNPDIEGQNLTMHYQWYIAISTLLLSNMSVGSLVAALP
jgi:hypothetical protein